MKSNSLADKHRHNRSYGSALMRSSNPNLRQLQIFNAGGGGGGNIQRANVLAQEREIKPMPQNESQPNIFIPPSFSGAKDKVKRAIQPRLLADDEVQQHAGYNRAGDEISANRYGGLNNSARTTDSDLIWRDGGRPNMAEAFNQERSTIAAIRPGDIRPGIPEGETIAAFPPKVPPAPIEYSFARGDRGYMPKSFRNVSELRSDTIPAIRPQYRTQIGGRPEPPAVGEYSKQADFGIDSLSSRHWSEPPVPTEVAAQNAANAEPVNAISNVEPAAEGAEAAEGALVTEEVGDLIML